MKILKILKEQLIIIKAINENNTIHKNDLSVTWQELIERVLSLCDNDISNMDKIRIMHNEYLVSIEIHENKRTVIDYLSIVWHAEFKNLYDKNSIRLRLMTKKTLNEIAEALIEVRYYNHSIIEVIPF